MLYLNGPHPASQKKIDEDMKMDEKNSFAAEYRAMFQCFCFFPWRKKSDLILDGENWREALARLIEYRFRRYMDAFGLSEPEATELAEAHRQDMLSFMRNMDIRNQAVQWADDGTLDEMRLSLEEEADRQAYHLEHDEDGLSYMGADDHGQDLLSEGELSDENLRGLRNFMVEDDLDGRPWGMQDRPQPLRAEEGPTGLGLAHAPARTHVSSISTAGSFCALAPPTADPAPPTEKKLPPLQTTPRPHSWRRCWIGRGNPS